MISVLRLRASFAGAVVVHGRFYRRRLVRLKSKPIREVLRRSLEHVFSGGGTRSFQSIEDPSHQHESIFAIVAPKGAKGLRRRPLVGAWHQVIVKDDIKGEFDGPVHDQKWRGPWMGCGAVHQVRCSLYQSLHGRVVGNNTCVVVVTATTSAGGSKEERIEPRNVLEERHYEKSILDGAAGRWVCLRNQATLQKIQNVWFSSNK